MEINSAFWIKMEPFHDKGMHLFRTIQAPKEEKGNKIHKFKKILTEYRMQSCFEYGPSDGEKKCPIFLGYP